MKLICLMTLMAAVSVLCSCKAEKGPATVTGNSSPLSNLPERITFFSGFKGYKATNPVIRDNGKFMAYQVAKYGDPAGVGRGILIFNFEK